MFREPPKNSREKTKNLLLTLQDKICSGLENVDGQGKFTEESWLRDEGGGGRSRVSVSYTHLTLPTNREV